MSQENDYRLSIVSVTYNQPDALARTLSSLTRLRNSTLPWELVLVDSSPDLNREILKSFSALPISHLSQPPNGIYPAMNAGLERARGDVVWFLNGGDELSDETSLRAALDDFAAHPEADLMLAAAELTRGGFPQYIQHPREGLAPMLGINRICHQALLYRRSLFARLGNFSEKYRLAADYELHLRALHEGVRTILFDRVIVRYDMGGQSSNSKKVFREFALIQRQLRHEGKLPGGWAHVPARHFELLKAILFRTLKRSPLGAHLQRVWHYYKGL